MRQRTTAALLAAWLVLGPARPAHAAPFCRAGEPPEFRLGFALLKEQLGPLMGDPVECEHRDPATGDSLQRTTTGLAYYRPATNTPAFTDGYRHWAWGAGGLVAWEGAGPEPAELGPPARAPLSPAELVPALLATPFEDSELPAGFAAARTLPPLLPPVAGPGQPAAVVRVLVRGPDFIDAISYGVYRTEAAAQRDFENPPTEVLAAPGFAQPAVCFTAPLRREAEPYGLSGCVVLVGNVEVVSTSIVQGAAERGNDDNAIALARAGIAHLERVKAP